ncbi:MAG: hypothetical protein CW716_07405, partial [Candidatus Bathyarchaeum sp.]
NEKYFDWVAVRKYRYPEPSHGSWGNEKEEAPADAEAGFEAGDTSEFCDTETSNGSITATDAVAHHGTYSCKCDVNADGNAYAEGYFDILEQEPVYCRGYFRFNQLPETNRDYTIISFENTDGPTTLGYVQLINDGGTKKWKIRRTTGGGAAYSTSTSNIPAVNTWVCVEFAHGENLAKLWVDGDELLTHADAIDQNIDRVHVGACSSDMDADNTLEIHVDCISVTDEYVGVETDLEVTNLAVNKVATLASAKSNNIILEYDYEHITISDLHLPTEDMPYKTYTDLDEEYGNIIFKHTGEADQDHQYPPYDKGRFGNFYLVMVQDPENNSIYQPIIATERGLWVEKDIQTYGVVMISTDPVKAGGGGAIMIGHGFTGPTCPPEIRLSESDLVNLVSHSENFGNAYWTGYPTNKDNITNNPADDEFKAPDNEKTAWKIVCDADCSGVVSSLIPFTAGPDYTLSVWLKGNAESEGEVVKIGIVGWVEEAVTLTTYWKRHKVSFISPGTSQRYLRFYKESSSGTYYAWGTQLTQSNIYRSYVPTTDGPNAPFDTLHITDRFGSNPANMDLGNLTANQINVDEIKTKAEGTYVWDLANMPNQGTSGYVLMAQGPGNAPVWASVDGGGPHTHVADDITSGTFDYDDVSFANQNMNQSDHPTFGSVTGTSTDAGLKAGNPNYFAVGIDGPDVFVTSFGDYHLRLSTAQNNKNVVIAPHGTGELDCNCNVDANSYGIGGTNIVTAGRVLQNVTMDASLLTGSITVDGGDVNVNSNLSVSDELDVTGLASFGNIQLSGEVASNLVPSGTSGTRYLGSSSKAWNFYLASGYIGSARFTAYCVPDNSGVNLGTAADPWNEVFAQTYKYHTTGALVYFDSLDDLGIIRNSKSMKVVGNDGIERDMVSLEGGMECVLADGSNKFASASKVNGLLFGAIKQLIAKVEALEADIKKIPREKTTTKQKGAA